MSTKAELERKVARLTEDNEILIKKYNALVIEHNSDHEQHLEQLDALASNSFPFDWHNAPNSYGKPVCLAGNYNNSEGFTVELYPDSAGDIQGIVVMNRDNLHELYAIGMVPAEIFRP